MIRTSLRLRRGFVTALALALPATLVTVGHVDATASEPATTTLKAPKGNKPTSVAWQGTFAGSGRVDPAIPCEAGASFNCDQHTLKIDVPDGYWKNHDGTVKIKVSWTDATNDLDLYVKDEDGTTVASSASSGGESEEVDLGEAKGGTYIVETGAFVSQPALTYDAKATFAATELSGDMAFPEDQSDVMDALTVKYPLRVLFIGRTPSKAEVKELRSNIPTEYKPTVANQSMSPGDTANTGASLLNWNKQHFLEGENPAFLGIKYKYDLQILTASKEYAQALFSVAKQHTAQDQAYHSNETGAKVAAYDESQGQFRLAAKGGDPAYEVIDPTVTDLVDAYAVEDWIFQSRDDAKWKCAFTNIETGKCVGAKVIQDTQGAYHDPYYDKRGLDLDRIPEGLNKGTSFLFMDTFTPGYASKYFRPEAYHTWGTDKVIDGAIKPKAVEEGGSWRITDPDTGAWDGVDFARTWGGRYRFHFVDLGAAPNAYESATWLNSKLPMSSDYPHGDPPIWQYDADPRWQQGGESCTNSPTEYTGGTACRLMPRLARSVAYGLFFRSTPGYLYRPIPRGDVNWLAVTSWTDFYSRPQDPTGTGQLTNAPWYGTWWTNTKKLYKIGKVEDGRKQDDTLRWLSSATPYMRWVGRVGEKIPLYDPTSNQPTGKKLDTSPKYADLPAPDYHVYGDGGGTEIVPEPLATAKHLKTGYGVDLTNVSNAIEKAKAHGVLGLGYDDSVAHEQFRDFIDAHREGIADRVAGVNTIPSINMVFEKAYTWALPAIVGGIAVGTADGEAWGVMNNVNDRFKSCASHYPAGGEAGEPQSLPVPCLPTQETGTGFSYTIEHEAAHNLGLSHPHDGSYGVDKCPEGSKNAGEWKCYWNGLGWMYDISAAPTTYAMSYRPYEVEDQDNLQRGHIAEYLIAAQEALKGRLTKMAKDGMTSPTSAWESDYREMKQWREVASRLFKNGDYLHAEYAARNASIAARGVPHTPAWTSEPRLLEAGQVYYFKINAQASDPIRY